jgi:hypothetical protein
MAMEFALSEAMALELNGGDGVFTERNGVTLRAEDRAPGGAGEECKEFECLNAVLFKCCSAGDRVLKSLPRLRQPLAAVPP